MNWPILISSSIAAVPFVVIYVVIGWRLATRWWRGFKGDDIGAIDGEAGCVVALVMMAAWVFTFLAWPVCWAVVKLWKAGTWLAERIRT